MRALILILTINSFVVAASASASETIAYTYDALGRLTQVARSGAVNNGVSESYSYDPANNRTNVTVSGVPAPPSFSINDVSVTEGGYLVFTVTKTGTTASSYSVNYAIAAGTATLGSDFDYSVQAQTGTLTFASNVTTQTVTAHTIDDATSESSETVLVNLSGATGGATMSDSQGLGTITDNDAPPNNPPTPVNDTGSQGKCSVRVYTVTTNDTDPEGDYPLTVTAVTGVGFTVYSSTQVQFESFSSTGNKVGAYTVRDSRGATANATLTVNVSGGTCTQAPSGGSL